MRGALHPSRLKREGLGGDPLGGRKPPAQAIEARRVETSAARLDAQHESAVPKGCARRRLAVRRKAVTVRTLRNPGERRTRYEARVLNVADTRVAVSCALIARSMPCIHRWRAGPESTSTERRGSTATSSPGIAPAA